MVCLLCLVRPICTQDYFFPSVYYCFVNLKEHVHTNINVDSTAWTGLFNGFQLLFMILRECLNQLPTPTIYYMHKCQDSLIQCSTSRLFCVNSNSLNLLLFVMNNRNGSAYIGTVHQPFQYFDISRVLGDRELVPHVCSYHMIK